MSDVASVPTGVWRPTALTDALLAPPATGLATGELDRLRADLVRELAAVIDDLPPGEQLVLDAHRLRLATTDPERCAGDGEFAPSPRLTKRAIGVTAVARWVRGHAVAPSAGVRDVLAAGLDDLVAAADPALAGAVRPPWWAEWYAELGPGGRAVVEAEAVTWATQLATALRWERIDPPPVVGGRDDWWQCPGACQLTLKGRAEVRAPVPAAGGRQALVLVASGIPGLAWRTELGFAALVASLVRGERGAPVRSVGWWPACGQLRVLEVDGPSLAEAGKVVVAATATWVDARIERRRAPTPTGR
ncbi:MAG TPA: hypothetical protein VMU09_06355 [Acidimicrobiales bacterium]|nr:hypothetical protein [Acidimicrobiales bacterium]